MVQTKRESDCGGDDDNTGNDMDPLAIDTEVMPSEESPLKVNTTSQSHVIMRLGVEM